MNGLVRTPVEAPPRIDALATLPVFFNLTGRRAAVIGGSAAAAWKAELLRAAGASVVVFAETVGPEMATTIASAGAGIAQAGTPWRLGDLSGFALIVADAKDDDEAAAIRTAARSSGTPCNVIDRPAFCDFSFGTIVNRAPVTIAVSTDGAAPVLGQAIRRRIEAVLPRSLGRWAAAAQRMREHIARALADRGPRNRFWARFADAALNRGREADPTLVIAETLEEIGSGSESPGRVTIVGAGPGHDEYLTLGAVRALQSADVVLYDSLVGAEVLELARREARRIDVGKRGWRPSCRQEDIQRLAIDLARAGNHVVRLKGGDPGIFGRTGEELSALRTAGIEVSIVPGVTAALALAARLGVSPTDRRFAHSVRFATAHAAESAREAIDWKGAADRRATTFFYMGGRNAGAIVARLTEEGLDGATPVAVGAAIGRPDERIVRTTLAQLAGVVATIQQTPILVGIGAVFGSEPPLSEADDRTIWIESGRVLRRSAPDLEPRTS